MVFGVLNGTGSCMTVPTAGNDLDTGVAIYEGDCNVLICIADNHDGPVNLFNYMSNAAWQGTIDTTYAILVAVLHDGTGPLNVNFMVWHISLVDYAFVFAYANSPMHALTLMIGSLMFTK